MMMTKTRPASRRLLSMCDLVAVLALLAASGPALSQTMKPGLWELRQQPQQLDAKRQAQMEQAQQKMAALPAEQRKMMEQMMASRGVNIDVAAGGAVTIKACVSKEQAERNEPPLADQGQCSHQSQRSGNVIRTKFQCNEPAAEGESEVTLNGSEGFSSKTRVTQQSKGKPETMTIQGEARWLGADCGTLKPRGR